MYTCDVLSLKEHEKNIDRKTKLIRDLKDYVEERAGGWVITYTH
jgi:hypothetical protein